MSKFKELMAQARQRESGAQNEDEAPLQEPVVTKEAAKAPAKKLPTTRLSIPEMNVASAPASPVGAAVDAALTNDAEPSSRGRGRPPGSAGGKRSHPDYEQVSAYLPRQTYREVKLALLQNEVTNGVRQEFSTLVAELLSEWLKSQEAK